MKRTSVAISMAFVSAAALLAGTSPGMAGTITGSQWNTSAVIYGGDTSSVNGSNPGKNGDSYIAAYSSSYGGSAELAVINDAPGVTDAYAGTQGNFGLLSNVSMSFDTANYSGVSGGEPYAVLTIFDGSGDYFDLVSADSSRSAGDGINASTNVGVWDFQTNNWFNGITSYSTPVPLGSLFATNDGNGVTFGQTQAIVAWADMGQWGATGASGTAYVNEMQVSASDPPTFPLFGVGFALLVAGVVRSRRRGTA